MDKKIIKLFTDEIVIERIQQKLPYLFQLAELESSRAGKIGIEVGSVREKIITALFIHKFGKQNVKTNLPITEPETDVIVFETPISIKTITGKYFRGIKLIWTVDSQKALEFRQNYEPSCDMALVQINWDSQGGFFYIPIEVQKQVLNELGRNNYIKLPKPGTNPRGVEMNGKAMQELINHSDTYKILINWKKKEIIFNQFERWVELWEKN